MELIKKITILFIALTMSSSFAGGDTGGGSKSLSKESGETKGRGGDSGGGPKSVTLNLKAKKIKVDDLKLHTVKIDGKKVKVPFVHVRFLNYEMVFKNQGSDKEMIREMDYVSRKARLAVSVKDIPQDVLDKLKNRKWYQFLKKRYYRKLARELFEVEICEKPAKKKVKVRRKGKYRRRH
tara:strand:+ start:56314 stop:56853 length:540 start_codon:yes stop_codon:yes gene_type:complete